MPTVAPPAPTAPLPSPTSRRAGTGPRALVLLGVVLVVVGSRLPWVRFVRTFTSWALSVNGILLGRGIDRGLAVGAVLLVVLIAILPVGKRLVFVLGAVATLLAGFALVRVLTTTPRLSPGAGLFVSGAGGVLMMLGALAASESRERDDRMTVPAYAPVEPVAAPPVAPPAQGGWVLPVARPDEPPALEEDATPDEPPAGGAPADTRPDEPGDQVGREP